MSYFFALIILFVIFILTVLTFLYLSGLLDEIKIEMKCPPMLSESSYYAYKVHEGVYKEAGYIFTEAYSINSSCVQCGIWSEEAEMIEPDASTSPPCCTVGSLLPNDDVSVHEAFEKAGFKLARLPAVQRAVIAHFPHVSVLSVPIGSWRAYRHLKVFMQENNLETSTFVELYDGNTIQYIALLTDAEKFNLTMSSTESPEPITKDSQSSQQSSHSPLEVESLSAMGGGDLPDVPLEPLQSISTESSTDAEEESDSSFEKITVES